MKTYFTAFLLLMSTFIFAQNAEYKKIETVLNKILKGSYALRGMYDPPSYSFKSASIAENGNLTLSYEEKEFTETYSLKNASISVGNMQVKISEDGSKKRIMIFTEAQDDVSEILNKLKVFVSK